MLSLFLDIIGISMIFLLELIVLELIYFKVWYHVDIHKFKYSLPLFIKLEYGDKNNRISYRLG